jgi:hypothetical protein
MTLTTSLIPTNNHPLYRHIEQTFLSPEIDENRYQESNIKQICLKTSGFVAVAAARLSMLSVCLTAGEKLTKQPIRTLEALAIGSTCSLGTVLGSGLISVLTVNDLVNALTRCLSPEEQKLFAANLPEWQRCANIIIALSGGIMAQVPMAIGSYFGSISPIPPLFAAASQIADFSRASYSIYKRLNELPIGCYLERSHPRSKTLIKQRECLADRIDQKKALIVHGSIENIAFLSTIEALIHQNATGKQFLEKFLEENPLILPAQKNLGIDITSKIAAIALLSTYFMIAFEGTKMLYQNQTDLAIPLVAGVLVVLANADILFRLTNIGANNLYEVITCKKVPSLMKEKFPNLYKILTVVATVISALPWAPSIYFADEYFPKKLQNIVGPISAIGVFLCSIAATYKARDIIVRKEIQSSHADREIKIQDYLEGLSATIRQTSIEQIADIYSSLPEELQRSLDPDYYSQLVLIPDPVNS